ncbi:MspA family porin [Nocardia sp. NPDC050412]|uniref:MspA family porin n=1 Tax=Nocardia sp. NPDC050412 TaxID=3364320 RepID=UPI0037B54FBC
MFKGLCGTAMFTAGWLVMFIPGSHAEVLSMAPHEKTYASPNGVSFTVGHQNEEVNRVPSLNAIGTTREVFVTNWAYGEVNGPASGTMKTGYHIGCAVDLSGIKFGMSAKAGFEPGFQIDPGIPTPTLTAKLGPYIGGEATLSVDLKPGTVADVQLGEKKLVNGIRAAAISRDFHLVLNGCIGPASIRAYNTVVVESPQVSDGGAVFGDPVSI